MTRAFVIAWKELLQLRRDRLTAAMAFVLPLMQLLLFGYAIDTDVRHLRTVICDHDASRESRDLVQTLIATGYFDVVGHVRGPNEIERALRGGEARVAVVIPPRLGSDLTRRRPTQVQLIVDGSDPITVASATSAAAGLITTRTAAANVQRLGQPQPVPSLSMEPLTRFNPELRTAVFIVPGLTGVLLTMTMVMLTAMAIARERERGTLEQLIVSPVGRFDLVIGKILPYVAIGYVQMTVVLIAGRIIFRVPIVGGLLLLYALAFLFISANLALGLLFSTLARTQQQAMQISFFFMLPNILLSGFMFPFEAIPRPIQWLAQLLPLTHFLRIARGITLKGARLAELGGEMVWLALLLVVLVVLGAARFRKRIA